MEITMDQDHVMVIDGALPDDLCDLARERYDAAPEKRMPYSRGKGQIYREGVCLTISGRPGWEDIDQRFFEAISAMTKMYMKRHDFTTDIVDNGYTIAEFEPGQVTRQHVDSIFGSSCFRLITFVIYLNEPGEGGETCFPTQGIQVKPKKGRAVLFPPFYTHPHRSNPATEKRYIAVTWVCSNPALYNPQERLV